jgi:hypothetical protein
MASNSRGVPALSAALIRPTRPEDEPDPTAGPPEAGGADEPADQGGGQGRGASDPRPAPRGGRRRRVDKPADKTDKRGLYLTRSVWERLQLEAIRKHTTASAIAGDILERNLPRLRIEREG